MEKLKNKIEKLINTSKYEEACELVKEKFGIEYECKFLKNDFYFDNDKNTRDIYEITLKRGIRDYTFNFGQSINDSGFYFKYGINKKYLDRKFKELKGQSIESILSGCCKTITHKNSWIKSLLDKNTYPIMFIIDEVLKNNWQFWEIYYINLFKSWGFSLTNSTLGGEGGLDNKESIDKMVTTRKKNNSYVVSDDRKKLMKIRTSGENNPFYNKKHTKETKNKIGVKSIGRCNKMVVEIDKNGEVKVWESISKAASNYNIAISTLVKCCKKYKNYKKAKNKKWEYVKTKNLIWIKCHCCGGTGKEYPQHINASPITCTVCNGYKIISELTGLPPSQQISANNSSNNTSGNSFKTPNIKMKQKTQMTTYETTKDIIIPKGTVIDSTWDGQFQLVLGYGKNFAQIVNITDMEGMFAEKLLKKIKS